MIDSFALSQKEMDFLLGSLEKYEKCYDSKEKMLLLPVPANTSYHTRLRNVKAHPVFRSLVYGVALLDSRDASHRIRAVDILQRILGLQDQDPESDTYGIWSWYLEEPLEAMAPPDWNFADFCGTQILEALLNHESRLPEFLIPKMDEAILHAARSIQRRNVGPEYTNIAIMGSFVTLAAAERLQIEDLMGYAVGRFRTFYENTEYHGAFNEYNSPTYTYIALNEIERILRHIRHEETLRRARELYRHGWELVASHFHAPTQQWAGPHCRSYSEFLRPQTARFLERSMPGRFQSDLPQEEPTLDEHRHDHNCPPYLVESFLSLQEARTVRQVFRRGKPDIVGTTYLHPAFTLGSVNHGDMWNQRRALIAYWGNAVSPKYMRVRFMHDGYDFSAAQISSLQDEGRVASGITFAYDGGDTHVSLDMLEDGIVRAESLCLRFQFGGLKTALSELLNFDGNRWRFSDEHVHIESEMPVALWAGQSGYWQLGGEDEAEWLEFVLYEGRKRSFNMPTMGKSVIGFSLQFDTSDMAGSLPGGCVNVTDDSVNLSLSNQTVRIPQNAHSLEDIF
ncbi:hypothetical protein [Puniceicoccus vermicola]|uniref:Heparinase n=1 Tax=Puniceicoccus vermicola TaxID=388746 RepID=A0A7X1B1F2_9BACT|nr:hypothetical protein [Puniceicoccus vermicola]MBC2602758.1 hypothetical protein [Puniceicoccus vermicola]